ncbi:Hypothetical protein A7982_05489 [Minicystis rosea]|nr:Hypothetical protein A7982_05489 [Minicystis rosea]
MERVSLTYFVDFVLKVGTPKLAGVKEFKEHRYDHLTDFYKPLREAVVDMHEKGRPDRSLDDFLGTLTDERKRRIFPGLVEGYRKFLGASPKKWFTPPHTTMPIGDLEININPELGFEIDGRPTLIKTYFRGEPLAQKRVNIVLGLISAALAPTRPGTQFAMLDVKNARLYPMKASPNPRLPLLLRGEAASFSTIYAAV